MTAPVPPDRPSECVYRFCHGSVDTPTTGVDTGFQTLRQNDEEKVNGVDTRPSSQRTQLTGLNSVSTQPQVVSTLDPVPRGPVCQTGTVCRHSLGVYRFCHGSVDTPTTGVDTGFQTLRQNDEEKCVDTASSGVDTASSGVDTRSSSQRTCLPDWDSVSTQSRCASTLVSASRRTVLRKWDSVSTHSLVLSSHSG
ncbi:hypothetical protein Taro_026911 [Colocasia esculenta]|uniref:Uncharacterized protein n=1 Tax=Colocasia esculenta TaxID=4460 RepID=A0A843VII7_COLES|nr:hypothetical protein [Colocasia esculenta]